MPDGRRVSLAWTLMIAGIALLLVGIFFAHAGFAPEPHRDNGFYLSWVPRHWLVFTGGQLAGFLGSQLLLAGAALAWVANQPMTWARALFAAWLAWFELVLLWGIVPSEWLNLTQGPLGWTNQQILFTIPPWLVLNNEISISYAVVKDAIAGGYHIFSLAIVIAFAVVIQKWGKVEAPVTDSDGPAPSPYGRPIKQEAS